MYNISRPIRVTGTGSGKKVFGSATRISSVSVTTVSGDVYVELTDGPGGQILWDIAADDATSSPCHTFPCPMFFPNGIYANIVEDISNGFKSLCVAVIEPQALGT